MIHPLPLALTRPLRPVTNADNITAHPIRGIRALSQFEEGEGMLAYDYPLLGVFWTILWFTLFFIWIWILISVFIDVFRSDDLSGWGKAGWVILIVILPFLGVLFYLLFVARRCGTGPGGTPPGSRSTSITTSRTSPPADRPNSWPSWPT
jgi:hypothetical protein